LCELVAQRLILRLVTPQADALMDDLRPGFTFLVAGNGTIASGNTALDQN
jgi:hypothetical protein